MFDEAETSSDVERSLDFVRGDPPLFDEAETSSGAHRNLDYRGQGLAPGAEFSRWFAELSVDIAGELLYNIDRLMSGNDLNVVDWKGLLV